MTVLDYRNPAPQPDDVATVEIRRHDDASVEVRVFPPPRPRRVPGGIGFAIVVLILAVYLAMLVVGRQWKIAAPLAVILAVVVNGRMQRVVSARAAHRWVVTRRGLAIERVSRGGYLTRRLIARDTIRDVRRVAERTTSPTQYLRVKRIGVLAFGFEFFHDLPAGDLDAIATAVREGLGLPPLNDPAR